MRSIFYLDVAHIYLHSSEIAKINIKTAGVSCSGRISASNWCCFKVNKKGKVIGQNASCLVSFAGDKLTISDVGGVSTFITWTAFATDASGNTGTVECSLQIANPGL